MYLLQTLFCRLLVRSVHYFFCFYPFGDLVHFTLEWAENPPMMEVWETDICINIAIDLFLLSL